MNLSNVLHNAGIAIGTAITGFFLTVPDAAMDVWTASPGLVKAIVPEEYTPVVTGVLTLGVAISRLVKARKDKGAA